MCNSCKCIEHCRCFFYIEEEHTEHGNSGLMTIFNMLALVPMAHEALDALNDYEKRKKLQ